jgi:hypothetical protein
MFSISSGGRSSCRVHGTSLILFLCLCVVFQMLGVPATLLDLEGSADLIAAAALEGLSLPPNAPASPVQDGSRMLPDVPLTAAIAVPPNSLFHPPRI